jgi:hypothetical protein
MYYHTEPTHFTVGERVELHPRLDLWMMGARYGTVTKLGRTKVTVKLDAGRTVSLKPSDLAIV